jgi:hypothetical protein
MRDSAPSTQPRGFLTKQHKTRRQLSSSSCLERRREVLVPHPFQSNLSGSSSFFVITFGSEDRISHSASTMRLWVLVILAAIVTCDAAVKKRKKFEGDFEFADDTVGPVASCCS